MNVCEEENMKNRIVILKLKSKTLDLSHQALKNQSWLVFYLKKKTNTCH